MMDRIIVGWDNLWIRYYEILTTLTLFKKIIVAFGFSLLTALSAQFYLPLKWTPIPVTGQVFTVLLAALLLGRKGGTLSQIFYLFGGGIFGINWFYGMGSGIFRPTTGYIMGFIIATYIIGLLTDKNKDRIRMIFAMLCGIIIILSAGTIWLALYLKISIYKAFLLGFLPFIAFDILKAYFTGIFAYSIMKNRS